MSTRRWSRRGGRLIVGSRGRSGRCKRQQRMGRCSTAGRIPGTPRSSRLSVRRWSDSCDLGSGVVDRVRLRDGAAQDDARDRRCGRAVRGAVACERGVPRTVPCRGRPPRAAPCPVRARARIETPARAANPVPGRVAGLGGPGQRHAPAAPIAGGVHPLLRRSDPGRRRARTSTHQGRGRARADAQRARRPVLQDPRAGRTSDRADPGCQHHRPDRRHGQNPRRES